MEIPFEQEHQDLLQNIEAIIISSYRAHPEMTDYVVMAALEDVIAIYDKEVRGRSAPRRPLPDLDRELAESIHQICEWRLGRGKPPGSESPDLLEDSAADPIVIHACLKRVLSSANRWNREGGRRGYLDFVKNFV